MGEFQDDPWTVEGLSRNGFAMIYPRVLVAASDLRQGGLLKNTLERLGFEVKITSCFFASASAGDWKPQIIAAYIPRQIYESSSGVVQPRRPA
ncbi:MAG: hypothetical protein KKH28_05495, partial [Elusimicrobia bacterium]|nr:hypothetical protein [Elusimicrobiota bacterium]